MSGILGGIANLAGALSQGQDQQNQAKVQSALQQASLVRQQQQDQIAQAVRDRQAQSALLQDQLTQAQIGDTTAQTDLRNKQAALPPKPTPKHYQYITGPDGSVSAVNEADPTDITPKVPGVQGKVEHTPIGPVPHFSIQNVTGADHQVHLARVNSLTGEVTELPNLGKQPGAGTDATHQMAGDHYGRAKAASDALDKFGGTVASNGQISNFIMGHNPFDSDVQNANQAGDEFATMMAPILNKGRSTHIEIEQVKKSYVPLASDTPEQLRIKSAARAALLKQYEKYVPSTPAAAPSTADPVAHLKSKYGLD